MFDFILEEKTYLIRITAKALTKFKMVSWRKPTDYMPAAVSVTAFYLAGKNSHLVLSHTITSFGNGYMDIFSKEEITYDIMSSSINICGLTSRTYLSKSIVKSFISLYKFSII